MKLFTGTTAV